MAPVWKITLLHLRVSIGTKVVVKKQEYVFFYTNVRHIFAILLTIYKKTISNTVIKKNGFAWSVGT